ncbi:hypothetical protein VTN96DRAFT_3017 [Rasamsonia emersonii]
MLRCKDAYIRSAGARGGSYLSRGHSDVMTRVGYSGGRLFKAASLSSRTSSWTYGQTLRSRLETSPRWDVVRRFSASSASSFALRDLLRDHGKKKDSYPKGSEDEARVLLEIATGKEAALSVSPKAVELEIKWLKDPKELADRVARLLKGRKAAMAAALVRRAQKEGIECMVAWNHLMAHCMDRGAPLAAFKFYNDMKKRGRRPNASTFTIMLDGLSRDSHQRGLHPVKTAYSIYKSIFTEKSGIRPNIIHFNAMLKVCGRHYDIDTLWKVVGDLPEEGPDAPDVKTYTIILTSINAITQRDVERIPPSQLDKMIARRAAGVRDGKRIWADIVNQWRTGRMTIDNHLVGTMANLLINGLDEHGCYDALALFNQTMGIPIFAKKPPHYVPSGSLTPQSLYEATRTRPRTEIDQQDDLDQDAESLEDQEMAEMDRTELEEDETEVNFEGLFDPVTNTTPDEKSRSDNSASTPALLRPGNVELSLILEACRLLTEGAGPGKQYWEYLTLRDDGPKVQPDEHSFHQYLRLLRVARSSRVALGMIRDQMVPANALEGKTFHIAMSCCRRDRQNPNVFNIANELLALMDTHLPLPDPRALIGYHELIDVLAANGQWLMMLNGLDVDEDKRSNLAQTGRKLKLALQTTAISKLQPHVSKLCEAAEKGQITKASDRSHPLNNRDDGSVAGFFALKALVRTRALMDTVLGPQYESLLSKSDRERIEPEAKKLRKFSSPEMVVKFEDSVLSPTWEQRLRSIDSRAAVKSDGKQKAKEPPAGTKQTEVAPKEEKVNPTEKQTQDQEHSDVPKESKESNEQPAQQ